MATKKAKKKVGKTSAKATSKAKPASKKKPAAKSLSKKKPASTTANTPVQGATSAGVPAAQAKELDQLMKNIPADEKKKLDNIKGMLEKFKDRILPRFEGYVMGISLLPPQQIPPPEMTPEEVARVPPAELQKMKDAINVLVLIDDVESVKVPKHELQEKIQNIANEIAIDIDKNLRPQVLLLSELWQQCYDGKWDILKMIAMSAIVYDTGTLQAVKIAEVHRDMVLKKFEKYIVSYVLAGSITRGKATHQSDVDVFLVIDDTDVKKMSRAELKDKLRAIIVGMGMEAGQMTGIQNKINIQVYILTDFWETLKDANPVIFTLLRDGVPLYDRGVFMPWKQLLAMGRVKPSPEAIDMFMNSGDQFMDRINIKIRDIVLEDLYWALTTPSQAALMMVGIPPPAPKELADVMTQVFVEKEGLLEPEYVKILSKYLKIHKQIEHQEKKKVSGKEMDELVQDSGKYLERLKKLFNAIEERKQEEKVQHTYENIITIIRDALKLDGITKLDEKGVQKQFAEHLIKEGHLPQRHQRMFDELVEAKGHHEAGRLTKQEVNQVLKESRELMNSLIEHIQRKRGREVERVRLRVRYGKDLSLFGEIVLLGKDAFIIEDLENQQRVSRAVLTDQGTLLDRHSVSEEEFEEALMQTAIPPKVFLKNGLFESLKQIFGSDMELLLNY